MHGVGFPNMVSANYIFVIFFPSNVSFEIIRHDDAHICIIPSVFIVYTVIDLVTERGWKRCRISRKDTAV